MRTVNMNEYSFEFWTSPEDVQRVSIMAACYEHARQIVIGRYAPIFLRRI